MSRVTLSVSEAFSERWSESMSVSWLTWSVSFLSAASRPDSASVR